MKHLLLPLLLLITLVSCGDDSANPSNRHIELVSHSIKSENGYTTVFATVKNKSNRLMTYVEANATLKDGFGTVIGTGMGNTTNLAAGATRTIDVIVSNVSNADTYEVEITNYHFD